MGLRQRLNNGLSAVRATASPVPFIADERWTSFHGITGATGWNNPTGRIEIASRAIWCYACIEARKGAIAFVPLKLYSRDESGHKTEVRDHPIVDLLQDINPVKDTPSSIRNSTEQGLCIHGRYTIKKVRNRAGIVKELYGLPQQYVQIEEAGNWIDEFKYEYYNNKRGKVVETYSPEDVIYFRYADYEDSVEGLAPLQVAVSTISADISIVNVQNAMSVNAARPSMIITVMNRLNDTDYAREDERIKNAYAGAVNAGKVMLVDNARDTKVTTVQLSPSEMQWIEEHKSHIVDICSAFQVTPGIVGDFAESSRLANAGTMHRIFGEKFVRGELQFWEDVYNWQLLWSEDWGHGIGWEREQGMFLEHDLTSIPMFREDDNAKSERAKTALGTGASVDDVMIMQGLNPIGGELGKKRYIPSNLVELGAQPVQKGGEPPKAKEEHTINQAGDKISGGGEQDDMQYAKAQEVKQYKKWRKKHRGGDFVFRHLDETEQRALSDDEPRTKAFYEALQEFRAAKNEPSQNLTIPVTVNIPPSNVNVASPNISVVPQPVNVTNLIPETHPTPIEVRNDIHVPEPKDPVIQVNVPESQVHINVPEPVVHVHVPEVTVNNEINVPSQDAPVVNVQVPEQNVTVNNTVTPSITLAENQVETDVVERDQWGRVARVVKISETKIETK